MRASIYRTQDIARMYSTQDIANVRPSNERFNQIGEDLWSIKLTTSPVTLNLQQLHSLTVRIH